MGLLSWLFPSPADRVERAKRALAAGRFRDAKDELDGIELPEAAALRVEADHGLVRLNLDALVSWAESGDGARVQEHLELAESLHHGGLEELFRDTRRRIREIRTGRESADAKRKSEQARLTQVDPLGLTGRGLLAETRADGALEDEEESQARLWLLLENYPADLRESVAELGPSFARAVLDLEDGRADLALQALLELPEQPLVCYERARCAWALGDPAAGAREMRKFAMLADGHRPVGNNHTALLLAQMLIETQDLEGALRVLRDARAREPGLGGALFAQILLFSAMRSQERDARLAEAETVVRDLLGRSSDPGLFALLGKVRVAGGHRVPAMRAYEQALAACCEVPGKCGSRPPDPGVQRALATLYLEDGIERERALELADKALAQVEQATWDDVYLEALAGRAVGDEAAGELAESLWERTPSNDPRRGLLERYLPQTA